MPIVDLRYKSGRKEVKEIAEELAPLLPYIIAPALTLSERESLDGRVTPEDIIVRLSEGNENDVNAQDIEIMIWAHDFPERRENLEEREKDINRHVRTFLGNRKKNFSGFVLVILQHMAFGKL